MNIPIDYIERVYAGVLGKIIGVYLGRPFEGWSFERIMSELGEINYYVHDKLKVPLIVTDDDISGTFTFLRALPDHGHSLDLTPEQIGNTWLNYLIENRTILWWGGLGNSTEHTAYLRLKNGIPAPQSGSMRINGKTVCEQIGAQIFIDGWGMVSPGDPERAANLAARAASVSHDGEAVYGAQVIAAMEAQAFIEADIHKLIDTGISFIPKKSTIYRMIGQIREWRNKYQEWQWARELITKHYGYDRFGGNCHIVPNHALIILALLYGEDDYQKSLMIVNTSGWDTDCNSGNLGCLLGIKNGLKGLEEGPDWRGPIADRLYLASADGGRVITDAVIETYHIHNITRRLNGEQELRPKNGARFHFELPGSLQGFYARNGKVENVQGNSFTGNYSLALNSHGISRFATATFILPDAINMPGYGLMASPTLYPGQKVFAGLSAKKNLRANLFIGVYDENDQYKIIPGPSFGLPEDKFCEIFWTIPETNGAPIVDIGFQMRVAGTIYLDYLGWEGTVNANFKRPSGSVLPGPGPQYWRRAWINGVDSWESWSSESFRIIQNKGTGLISIGTREWTDYSIKSNLSASLIKSGGVAIRIQGMRRYYALVAGEGDKIRLIKLKDDLKILAEGTLPWNELQFYEFTLQAEQNHLTGSVNGVKVFDYTDDDAPLLDGAAGLVIEEGTLMAEYVEIGSIS